MYRTTLGNLQQPLPLRLVQLATKLIEIAGMLKLNMNRFKEKMKDPALKELINHDYDDAKKLGITATPWVYINGRHLKERSLPDFVDAIDKELKK